MAWSALTVQPALFSTTPPNHLFSGIAFANVLQGLVGQRATGVLLPFMNLVEFSSVMRPAGRFNDSTILKQLVIAGVSIDLQHAGKPFKCRLGFSPLRFSEYWYQTAGGDGSAHARSSRA